MKQRTPNRKRHTKAATTVLLTAAILGLSSMGATGAANADDATSSSASEGQSATDGLDAAVTVENSNTPTPEPEGVSETGDTDEDSTPSSPPTTPGNAEESPQTSAPMLAQADTAASAVAAVVPCEGQAFLVFERDATLNIIDPATGAILNSVDTGYELNAVGYNVQDGYLYGVTRRNDSAVEGGIYRISLDGTAEQMTVSGPDMVPRAAANKDKGSLPVGSDIVVGDVDENGIYWAKTRSGILYGMRINADGSLSEVSMSQVNVQSDGMADFSALPGSNSLWTIAKIGVAPRSLGAIDKYTGVYTDYGVGSGFDQISGVIGSYFDSAGNMYAFTDSGEIWAINRGAAVSASGAPTGVPLVARKISDVKTSASGDAAQCGFIKSSSLNIDKSVDQATATAGSTLNYVITVTNTGETPLAAITVTDTLPANLTDAVAEDGGAIADGRAQWILDLAPGEGRLLHIHGQMAASIAVGETVLNSASADGPGIAVVTIDHVCEADSSSSCAQTTVVEAVAPATSDGQAPAPSALSAGTLASTGVGDQSWLMASTLLLLGLLSVACSRRWKSLR